jgi:glycosyltransferase involved in cell wall biosynthesis
MLKACKKILFLSRYTRVGASSRVRTFQYQKYWEIAGFETYISSFFNEQYLNELYNQEKINKRNVFNCYLKRFIIMINCFKYDLIWIEKEIFPFLPPFLEWFLFKTNKKLIVDFDDAFFLNYENHESIFIRFFMRKKIDKVIKYASLVMVGNKYLEDRAIKAGARKICLLPTVISSEKYYHLKQHNSQTQHIKIGWIGSPTTIKYLKNILPFLEKLNQSSPIELLVVHGSCEVNFSGKMTHIKWSEEQEVNELLKMDIGIMPLPNTDWEKGKCAYKLIQYMACGVPVVASPVGMNNVVVKNEINGFLASNEEEWLKYLTELILNPEKRQKMGQNGFEMVHSNYTIEVNFKIMLDSVHQLLHE